MTATALSSSISAARIEDWAEVVEPVNEADLGLLVHRIHRNKTQDAWIDCIKELLRLRELEDDWDGEGARSPATENVDRAIEWVYALSRTNTGYPAPDVAPGLLGEVLLIWKRGGLYLEVEIASPRKFDWMLRAPGLPPFHTTTRGAMPPFNFGEIP